MKLWSAAGASPGRRCGIAALAAATLLSLAPAAWADCQSDVNGLMKKRMAAVAAINASAKKSGGKLDPIVACPQLRSLAAIESEAATYFTKNGEWCNLPPDFAQKMTDARAKSQTFAAKACAVAVKMKTMQAQQAQQAAEALPKLPTGPL